MQLRTVFFGSPPLALETLDALKEASLLPTLIVTMPDAPEGRRGAVVTAPVKEWAKKEGVDVLQPASIDDEELQEALRNTEWDLFIVAAYGMIIPKEMLDLPKHGVLNMHPSLLPKYRGVSPFISQILADDPTCGVSIILLDEKMDHGPILAQSRIVIEDEDWPPTGEVLGKLLAEAGGELLAETIRPWVRGEITPEDQDHSKATFTKKFSKSDGELDLDGDRRANYLKICAFTPWPGTYFFVKRKDGNSIRVKVTDAEFENNELTITRVIPEGKKEMGYDDFLRGI